LRLKEEMILRFQLSEAEDTARFVITPNATPHFFPSHKNTRKKPSDNL
jgi:hypothetical protein